MPKHGQNASVRAIFTYQERQKLTEYGTQTVRLGDDSQKKFGMCSLYLHKVQQPMCCDKGHIFCKNCGIEHLVIQKKQYAEQLQKWQNNQEEKEKKSDKQDKEQEEKKKQLENFQKFEGTYDPVARKEVYENNFQIKANEKPLTRKEIVEKYTHKGAQQSCKEQMEISFWMPENNVSVASDIKKPDQCLKCPATHDHTVKLKKLIQVNIKEAQGSDNKEEYLCYMCDKTLNYQKIGMSKKCGHVMCLKCIQVAVKESQSCGLCMKKCDKSDILELESSNSSYSHHNKVEAKGYNSLITI